MKNMEKKDQYLILFEDIFGKGPAGPDWRLRCEDGFVLAQAVLVSLL